MKGWLAGTAFAIGAGAVIRGWVGVEPLTFHAGLLAIAVGLGFVSSLALRSGRSVVVVALNTCACLLVGIVLVDRFWDTLAGSRASREASYSFIDAQGDPGAFVRWQERSIEEQKRTGGNLMPDPRGVNPHVLRPGPGRFLESSWTINSLGFRGSEVLVEKGDRYRIVALGESTTFGATLLAEDRPWPEILEDRIASEWDCSKPVQVINAGIPGFTLANNLARLAADLFPLQPDLILSYHGYNGFPYLLAQIPSVRVGKLPEAPPRPSPLLARAESALRVWWFKRRYDAARSIDERALETDVHLSRYAALYRELISKTRAGGVDLVLATFNMAVTPESAEEVIRFYEPVFPDLRARILANWLHTGLVQQIGAQYGVPVIDTSPGLDGAYEDAFVDPIHFSQVGRERLAARLLEGLREVLIEGPAQCRERESDGSEARS